MLTAQRNGDAEKDKGLRELIGPTDNMALDSYQDDRAIAGCRDTAVDVMLERDPDFTSTAPG